MNPGKAMGANYWREIAGRNNRGLSDAFRDRLICPDDDAPLEFRDSSNELICTGCGRLFPLRDSILHLMPSDDPYRLTEPQIAAVLADNKIQNTDNTDLTGVLRHAGEVNGRKVLDLCCGQGRAALRFAEMGALVAALDIDAGESGLATLAGNVPPAAQIDVFRGDVCRLPFASETFDIVYIGNAISKMPRPERMMREVARVLALDGIVLNSGEPIGSGGISLGAGAGDPRRSGRGLSLADYRAIYLEAGLDLTVENLDGTPRRKSGLFSKLTGKEDGEEQVIFVARHRPGFQLPTLRIPWKKKEAKP